MSLIYKGLPYKTEWVELPDIEPTLKRLGAPPTSKKPDRSDKYTFPAIYDDTTKRYVSDSWKIAEYLDETYPSTPRLFPPGSKAAIDLFQDHFERTVKRHFFHAMIAHICHNLNPRSEEAFRSSREAMFNCKLEEIAPAGPKRDEVWSLAEQGLSQLSLFLSKNGPDSQYFFGDTFSFADVIILSFLSWVKIESRADDEWKLVETWDDGRWVRLLSSTEKYHAGRD